MKKITALLIFLVLLAPAVFASEYGFEEIKLTADKDTEQITAEGRVASHRKGVGITFEMINPTGLTLKNTEEELNAAFDEKFARLISGELMPDDTFEQLEEFKTDKDGYFQKTYKIDGISGTYKIVVKNSENDDVYSKYINFYSSQYISELVSKINNAKNTSEVYDILKDEIFNQDMDNALYESVVRNNVKTDRIWTNILNADKFSSFSELNEFFIKELATSAMCSGNDALWERMMEEYSDILNIGSLKTYAVYKSYTADEAAKIKTDVSKNTSNNTSERIFAEAVFMNEYKKLTQWTQVNNFIKNNADSVLGLETGRYLSLGDTTVIDKAFVKAGYTDFDLLASEFNRMVKASGEGTGTGPSGSNSSGGGGGGGAGGSGISYNKASVAVDITVPDAPAKIKFTDLESSEWAQEAIYALADKGIVKGIGDNAFAPDEYVTREQFVTMIVNLLGLEQQDIQLDFMDVNSREWYYDYLCAAVAGNIVHGKGGGLFGIGDYVTRQDMAVIAARALEMDSSAVIKFSDKDEISGYAVESVGKMTGAGIINGFEDNTFRPFEPATRAQAAKIIYGLMKMM